MHTLQKIYDRLHTQKAFQADLEKAKERFRFRPFAEKYRPLLGFAQKGRIMLGLFSVGTAWQALADPLASALPYSIACGLAVLILIGLEYGKTFFLDLAFDEFYQSGKASLLGIPAVVLLGLSVWLSLTGIQSLYKNMDRSQADLQAVHGIQIDSVRSDFEARIQAEKQALADFKRSVTWQGRIDTYNKTNRAVIEAHTQRIGQLEADQRQALGELTKVHTQQTTQNAENQGFNIAFWVVLSGANEFLILLTVWFSVFYLWKINQDSELIQNPSGIAYNMTIEDVATFADHVLLNGSKLLSLNAKHDPLNEGKEDEKRIGFHHSVNHEISRKNQENSAFNGHSVRDHSALIADIQSGIHDYRTLTQRHKVNIPTVSRYLKKYRKA